MPYIQHLIDCPLFAGLTENQIATFRPATNQVSFEEGAAIIREGERGVDLVILIKGRVTISKKLTLLGEDETDERDKTFITLDAKAKPFFGEMALLLDDSLRTATVTASTDCEMVVMEKEGFLKTCMEHPEVGVKVMENIEPWQFLMKATYLAN